MATPTVDQLAEAEQRYHQLKAQADAERAEREERQADWQRQRDELTPEFWQAHKAGYLDRWRDTLNQAWQAFTVAIRDGKPGITEWTAYRSLVLRRHEDKHAIDGYHHQRAAAAYQARAEAAQRIQATLGHLAVGQGSTEARTADNMGLTLDEYRHRRDEGLRDAERTLGRTFTRDTAGILAALHALPDYVGFQPVGSGSAPSLAPHGARDYAQAVAVVTEQQAREAVEQQQAERQAALTAWLDERLPRLAE